jgi:nitrite reductase (NO-forming)
LNTRSLRTALVASVLSMPLFASHPVVAAGPSAAPAPDMTSMAHAMPNAIFTLRTGIAQGKMVHIGKGGAIDGKVNPVLVVHEGDVVQITIINGEGAEHDIVVPDVHAASQRVSGPGASSTLAFHANDVGSFLYFYSRRRPS